MTEGCAAHSGREFNMETNYAESPERVDFDDDRSRSTNEAEDDSNNQQFSSAAVGILIGGKPGRINHPADTHRLLVEWLEQNLEYPYPSHEQKKRLAEQTGLQFIQVAYWFTNARRRLLPSMLKEENQRRSQQGLPIIRRKTDQWARPLVESPAGKILTANSQTHSSEFTNTTQQEFSRQQPNSADLSPTHGDLQARPTIGSIAVAQGREGDVICPGRSSPASGTSLLPLFSKKRRHTDSEHPVERVQVIRHTSESSDPASPSSLTTWFTQGTKDLHSETSPKKQTRHESFPQSANLATSPKMRCLRQPSASRVAGLPEFLPSQLSPPCLDVRENRAYSVLPSSACQVAVHSSAVISPSPLLSPAQFLLPGTPSVFCIPSAVEPLRPAIQAPSPRSSFIPVCPASPHLPSTATAWVPVGPVLPHVSAHRASIMPDIHLPGVHAGVTKTVTGVTGRRQHDLAHLLDLPTCR